MSHVYVPVQWNRTKWFYDAVLLAAVGLYLTAFFAVARGLPPIDGWILQARAFGSCAFLMLTLILCVGPLARLDARFLPLLYNRRHAGVIACVVALMHFNAIFSWYYDFTRFDRYAAVLAANSDYGSTLGFPFEALGVFALLSLLALAATSHDFWLSFLTPPVWKRLHLLIYPAYAAVVGHVMLGSFQSSEGSGFGVVVGACALGVAGLHGAAWAHGRRAPVADAAWVEVPEPAAIEEGRARVVDLPGGGRAAVWRHAGAFHATSNACAHQNGPLGEGRILDGCVTCPWHGFQFRVTDGRSPAPYTDRIPVHDLKRQGQRLFVSAQPRMDP